MSTAEQLPGSEAVDVTKSDSESSEELEVKAIRCTAPPLFCATCWCLYV